MLGVKYQAPIWDGSGYAEFSRNFISAIHKYVPEIDLTINALNFEAAKPQIGQHMETLKALENRDIPYQVKVINALPTFLQMTAESKVKNICFTMFETSRIPSDWVEHLNNRCDAVFVPSTWNKKVFQDSGVTKPIYVVHPGIQPITDTIANIEGLNIPKDMISFYSIYQWTERKNPEGLIRAFYAAFDGIDDVCLVLKTYGADFSDPQQLQIKRMIAQIKQNVLCKKHPPIIFVGGLLTNEQVISLHKQCDIFVLPHRGEGWGMPHCESMAYGKPIITTGYSGNMDFTNDANSFLLPYQMTVVCNLPWIPYYQSTMRWAEPDLDKLVEYMQYTYRDIKNARANNIDCETFRRARQGQADVLQKFNWQTSAESFYRAVKEVANG